MNDTYTVTIRYKGCLEALAQMAKDEIREPEQQLNWEVERLLLRHAKPADNPDGKPAVVRRGTRAQSAAA